MIDYIRHVLKSQHPKLITAAPGAVFESTKELIKECTVSGSLPTFILMSGDLWDALKVELEQGQLFAPATNGPVFASLRVQGVPVIHALLPKGTAYGVHLNVPALIKGEQQ